MNQTLTINSDELLTLVREFRELKSSISFARHNFEYKKDTKAVALWLDSHSMDVLLKGFAISNRMLPEHIPRRTRYMGLLLCDFGPTEKQYVRLE